MIQTLITPSVCLNIFRFHNNARILKTKYPAASNGVSTGIQIIAPRGGELYLHPPPADYKKVDRMMQSAQTDSINP